MKENLKYICYVYFINLAIASIFLHTGIFLVYHLSVYYGTSLPVNSLNTQKCYLVFIFYYILLDGSTSCSNEQAEHDQRGPWGC